MKVLACNSPFNEGGMGKFFADLVEQARATNSLERYFSSVIKPNDMFGHEISLARWKPVFQLPMLRHNYAQREFLAADLFDSAVARLLTRSDIFVGFSGRTLRSFGRARQLGFDQLVLESATSHVAHVRAQHQLAAQSCPLEKSWLNDAQLKKTLREYQLADTIIVTSEYSMQTFLQQGIPSPKLQRRWQSVAPRFAPRGNVVRSESQGRDAFSVVYVGRLQVSKGLPVLLQAFAQLKNPDAELVLVGGCATDAVEEFLLRAIAADPRIKIRPGDPLPHLHRADVLAHPSWEDGLALGPMEALACGVPVIVTQDTGMREFVIEGVYGFVVPTGDANALAERLQHVYKHPLKGFAPPSFNEPVVGRPILKF